METDHSIRVNVVGNFCQGKTSLVRRLVGQSVEDVKMTNGIDVDRYHCQPSEDGSFDCKKINFSRGGRDFISRIISIAKSIEAERNAKINDGGNVDSDEETNEVFTDFKNDIESNEELQSFLEEIKSGKTERTYSTEQLYLWDFGGQYVFYATHTMFHSSKAIYLLVFDLSRSLDDIVKDEDFPTEAGDKTMEYFIKFWLNSIHSFVGSDKASTPLVILVGTHKDQLPGTETEKLKSATKYFENIRQLFEDTDVQKHIHTEDFAIDNTDENDSEISRLRKELLKIGQQNEFINTIPAKWIPLENSLNKLTHNRIVTFEKVMEEDAKNEFPIGNEEQVKMFLQYHHAKGTVVFFDEDVISKYIVLDPQYLIDAFKCIITSQRFCNNNPTVRPFWKKLMNEARLESELIDYQWNQNDGKDFMKWRDILLAFLQKHFIISEALEYDEKDSTSTGLGWYIVPSLLKDHRSQDVINEFLAGKKRTILRLVFQFENSSVVEAEYDRLIAASLGKWSVVSFRKKHLLFKDMGVFRIDSDHVGVIEEVLPNQTIELVLVGLCGGISLGDKFRRFTESVFCHAQRQKGIDSFSKSYTVMYRCNHESHGQEKSRLVKRSDVKMRSKVACEDYENHTFQGTEADSEWFHVESIKPYDVPEHQLSEKVLSRLSQAISDNWELLGPELGVSKAIIGHVKEENRTTAMKIYEMLYKWRHEAYDQATFQTLFKAFEKVPTLTVDWDMIRNIIDDVNTIQITHF